MIQRIQSVYFLISAIIAGLVSFFVPFYNGIEAPRGLVEFPTFMIAFMVIAGLSLLSLLMFKNRRNQVVFARLAILVSFAVFGFMLYFWYEAYDMKPEHLATGVFLPLANVILLSLANRAVMNDEAVVKAADRFR